MPGVTRDVEPSALEDLIERPPRATVAFVQGDQVDVVPVRARCRAETYRFGVLPAVAASLEGREVVLVIDDGPYFFELRGISVRGQARREPAEPDGLTWYAIEPRRILAWDYAAMRES
ncbi:MAG TPA: hypothetical protein VFW70_12080 [Methylomirabilota bacterium]|nr:hypothetical protein [Methylomirabilota bacterium]